MPDIVSPTSPILTQSFNNFAEHRNRREGRKGDSWLFANLNLVLIKFKS